MDEKLNKKESTITREKKAGFGFHLLLIFLFLAIGIGTSGYHYYKNQKTHLRELSNNQLCAIADLKVAQIISLAFGLIIGAIALALAFGVGGRETAAKELEEWVKSMKSKTSK